ncbi:MAG TPA: DUF3810 family protein [Candidatus Baltobacteraceae bacterium]|nr:DUF3810 family protein [Candidatus Baltobacteraceae bacterium]
MALVAVASAIALARPPASWIERWYEGVWYPFVDRGVRLFVDPIPASLGDGLLIVVFGLLVWFWLDLFSLPAREEAPSSLARAFMRSVILVAGAYVWFMASWGMSYNRVPIEWKIVLHRERTDSAAVDRLADRALAMMDANAGAAHAEMAGMPTDARSLDLAQRLRPTWNAVVTRLGTGYLPEPVPVKPTIFAWFMRATGTHGFTDPWTHEINMDDALFPYEQAAVYAHEWGHIAGFADESEANYISVLACTTSSDPLLRYSGWLLVWSSLPANIHTHVYASRLVIEDIKAIIAREQRDQKPTFAKAQRVAYGTYLRANHIAAGYADYNLFIRLLTAGDYDAHGLPILAR